MSETFSSEETPRGEAEPLADAPQPDSIAEFPVPLSAFAATLRPRRVPLTRNGKTVVFKGRPVMTATAGHPDEIWLKLLKLRHGTEKRTHAQWRAAIDALRNQPAYGVK
jgi:hypothetical protein